MSRFDPRPQATPPTTIELVVKLRNDLTASGLDAGPDTIAWHLQETQPFDTL